MALIVCKECGKKYSNRARECPVCACPTTFNDVEEIHCVHCGAKYPGNQPECPRCQLPTKVQKRRKRTLMG